MLPLNAFLGSLPPASLAATDLCRFATRALNRRTREELPELLELLEAHALSGYPEALPAALAAIVERLVAEGRDPADLDPERLEAALQTRPWLEAVGARTRLIPQHFRPGLPVSTAVRAVTQKALRVLPGVGPQLVLVAPVEAVRVGGLGWSCLRGPVWARPMDAEEADQLRAAWAVIEELFGWKTPAALVWEARFLQLSLQPSVDSARAAAALAPLGEEARRRVWQALVEHCRDQELGEGHRPGPKGLERRLSELGVSFEPAALGALTDLATLVYEACAADADVERGVCPCSYADLAAYGSWVDVALSARQRLEALPPALIEHHLRVLAEVEAGTLDVAFDETLRRDLRGLRDGYLKLRYRRRVDPLRGTDPLHLARELIAAGKDRGRILDGVQSLADEARLARAEASAVAPTAAPAPAAGPAPGGVNHPGGAEPAPAAVAAPPAEDDERTVQLPVSPFSDFQAVPAPVKRKKTRESSGLKNPFAQLNVPAMPLPPMPRPPESRRRITTRPIQLPPMPDAPPPRTERAATEPGPGGAPPAAAGLPRGRPRRASESTQPAPRPREVTRPPTPAPAPAPAAAASRPGAPAPAPAAASRPGPPAARPAAERARRVTASHLVTPNQANAFYEEAFRELQILERDLLERGPWRAAADRLHALQAQAQDLADALGPSARSGDEAFRAALKRVEIVLSYLERVLPLLDGPPLPPAAETPGAPPEAPAGEAPRSGVLRRLGRLFTKRTPDEP